MSEKTNLKLENLEDKNFLKTINLEGPERAAFTHFIHNSKNKDALTFKKGAREFVKEYLYYVQPQQKINKTVAEDALQYLIAFDEQKVTFPAHENPKFTFIDLFAGIGGFRMAMQNLGGKCVFTSEWDKYSKQTYAANFGEIPFGDITSDTVKNYIPKKFDVLCAGFPCQAFSIAGKRGGFEDTRGTLFFHVAEIIKKHKPKAIFLENVKGLTHHDGGKTLATILNVLRNDLGYFVPEPQIIDAKDFGVPQKRARVFITGFREDLRINEFKYPKSSRKKITFGSVREQNVVPSKYYLSAQYLQTLKEHRARHESKGQGFGFEIIPDNGIANAIVCGGMGRERNLVRDDRLTDFNPTTNIIGEINREGIRKMTPREWARLQGFPDKFIIPVSDAQAYKQFGNSVAVPAIQAMGKEILKRILRLC
jgi:DNA (cytosine-5)-methyltransferase 1